MNGQKQGKMTKYMSATPQDNYTYGVGVEVVPVKKEPRGFIGLAGQTEYSSDEDVQMVPAAGSGGIAEAPAIAEAAMPIEEGAEEGPASDEASDKDDEEEGDDVDVD